MLPPDWEYLFRNPPPVGAPAPNIERFRFGISTPQRDPVH